MIELAFLVAAALSPNYANGADIRGPRPPSEVRTALAAARPALERCMGASPADLFLDVEVLAAGFVDRTEPFASAGTLDEPCVVAALRAMVLSDRGLEPATHVIVHLASRDGSGPHPTPREIGSALEIHEDDMARCVAAGRRAEPTLAGSLVLAFTVRDDGAATVRVNGGTLKNDAVHACIARELAGLRFDVGDAGERGVESVVAWPLFFARPRAVPPAARARSAWQEPTLFDFLGCGAAFPTS